MGKMNIIEQYNIRYKGINEGAHAYSFQINASFFSCFENCEISKGDIDINATLHKTTNTLKLDFELKGFVELICDRCSQPYNQEISNQASLLVKFSENEWEQSDEILIVSPEDNEINISKILYEYINLSIPMKRIHPEDTDGNPGCNIEALKELEKHQYPDKEEEVDERWNELKKLLN